MALFNNRNWWKQLGQLIVPTTLTKRKDECEWSFFFSGLPTSQSKIAKIELRTQFWRVFLHVSKNSESKKNVGISNDFDMTHVARNANYQGSLTTPVPCFFLSNMKGSPLHTCRENFKIEKGELELNDGFLKFHTCLWHIIGNFWQNQNIPRDDLKNPQTRTMFGWVFFHSELWSLHITNDVPFNPSLGSP